MAAAAAPLFTLLSINQPQAGARPQTWLNKYEDSCGLQAQKYFKQKNKYSVSYFSSHTWNNNPFTEDIL